MKKAEIKKLDRIWSKAVKELAGYKCEYCLEEDCWLESAHIIGRASVIGGRSTRWGAWVNDTYDLNGMCLCSLHHKHFDNHGKLRDSIFNNVVGQERYDGLKEVGGVIAKHQDFEKIRSWILGVKDWKNHRERHMG